MLIMNSERGAVVHDEGVVIGHPCDGNMSDHYDHDGGDNESKSVRNHAKCLMFDDVWHDG